uniref:Protein abrupt n=1 Tax=Culex pipiens TaxID=7175 RepID=A0A8D8DW65_CULPI
MTTASVANQQHSQNLRRPPASSFTAARMNETQQMHPSEHTSPPPGSIHNNNNNNNSKNRANTNSSNDAKLDHHLALLAREHRERERENSSHHSSHQLHQQLRDQLRDRDQSSSSSQQQQQHQNHMQHRTTMSSPTPSEQQQYALKWNDFQSSILSSFRHLRDEEDFVDVTIACEARSFTAHKVVLSACSPYFRKLLKANPCEHPIVILRDVRSEDIESLLRFMYNGEVHIGQDQLSDFLKTAQLLQVRGLADVPKPGSGNGSGHHHQKEPSSSASSAAAAAAAAAALNSSSLSTPAVQELKASPTSTSLPWELPDDSTPAPPPQKRTKSSELYRKQHGLSPDDPIPLDLLPVPGQHPLTRERDRSKDKSKLSGGGSVLDFEHRDRDRSLELRESLLGQALEGGPTLSVPSKHPDLSSLQAMASGEDSNSSDTAASDHGDDIEGMNGNVEHTRPSFPFLGLQGIPGLIPGPSGMHGDNFDARQHCDTLIKEEAADEDDEEELHRQRHQQQQQHQRLQQHHRQQQQQQQQRRGCLSASIDRRMDGTATKYEPEGDGDSRHYMDEDEEEDEEGIDDEDMKEDGTMDSDYHKQLAAAGVLAAAAAAASGNGSALGDGSDQGDFFVAHKSGSRDLALKQHIMNEKARLQAHLQRHQQQLAGFLLSTTAAAATTPPTSTPQNCVNNPVPVSPFATNLSGSSLNDDSGRKQKQNQQSQQPQQNATATANLFNAYNNANNSGSGASSGQVYLLPCPLCEVPLEPRVFRQHLDRHYPRDSPVCPVIQCGRRFAHPNSVRNHMRLKHTSQWAKMKAMRSSGGPFTGIP